MTQKPHDSGINHGSTERTEPQANRAEKIQQSAKANSSHEAELGMEAQSKAVSEQTTQKRLSRKSGATKHGVASADSLLPKDQTSSEKIQDNNKTNVLADQHAALKEKQLERASYHPQESKELSNLSGKLTSPDGKHSFPVEKGQILGKDHKPVARLLADGTLQFPNSNPQRANEDINVAFRAYKFDGTENGLARHFVATSKLPDGKLFLPNGANQNTECIVRMGMIIDKHTGKQIGNFDASPAYEGNKLNPGKIVFANDPSHSVSLTDTRFKNAVFDIDIKGQVFEDDRRLQGVCTGDPNKPTIDLQNLIQQERKVAEAKDAQFQSQIFEKTVRALFGDKKVYAEHDAISQQLTKTTATVNEILRTGRADISKLTALDKQTALDNKAASFADKLAAPTLARPPRPNDQDPAVNRPAELNPPSKNHHKPEAAESTAPHNKNVPAQTKSHIPEITTANVSKINGILRIDDEVYKVKHGQLFKVEHNSQSVTESKTPCGVLGPDYLFQLQGEKVASLADQNRVLMKFQIEGDRDPSVHMLLGLGSSYINKSGERVAGGLVSAKDLTKASLEPVRIVEKQKQESEAKRNWFDKVVSSSLTAGLDQESDSALDKSKALAVQHSQSINSLFTHGFDTQNFNAAKFDAQNKDIRQLLKDSNLSAVSSAELIQKHEITNTLIREGLITGAATTLSVVATAATDGLAAPVAAANVARGAQLISMARSLGTTATAVGSLNAVLRYKEGNTAAETVQQTARNFGDGALQGLAMRIPAGQIKEAGDIIKASNVAKTVVQTELFQAGYRLRETGSVLPANNVEATSELAASTGLALFTHGIGLHINKIPVLGAAVKDADDMLAKCAQMRANGVSAEFIDHLQQQAQAKKQISAYLLNATHNGIAAASFSGMPAIPEAVEHEKQRIAHSLGKNDISAAEFLQHMKLENISSYVIERAGIAAVTAATFSTHPIPSARELHTPRAVAVDAHPANESSSAASHTHEKSTATAFDKLIKSGEHKNENKDAEFGGELKYPSSDEMQIYQWRGHAEQSADAVRQAERLKTEYELTDKLLDGLQVTLTGDGIEEVVDSSARLFTTVLDRTQDHILNASVAEAEQQFESLKSNPEQLARALADYAREKMTPAGSYSQQEIDMAMTEMAYANHGKDFLLGTFIDLAGKGKGAGVCLQQAMFFKVLCDHFGLECNFVWGHGGKPPATFGYDWYPNHAWAEVKLEGQTVPFDIRNNRYGSDTYHLYPARDIELDLSTIKHDKAALAQLHEGLLKSFLDTSDLSSSERKFFTEAYIPTKEYALPAAELTKWVRTKLKIDEAAAKALIGKFDAIYTNYQSVKQRSKVSVKERDALYRKS